MRPLDGWIQTYSGKAIWPLNPRVDDIDIEDIAHALSNQCRYAGHTRSFYSVAQHCVLASLHVPDADALWALLHDAGEAYLCNLPRPVKRLLPDYKEAEIRLERVIAERFGLAWPMPDSVKRVDLALLAAERRDLMGPSPHPWMEIEQVNPIPSIIRPWRPDPAKEAFLGRFRKLTGESE